MSHTHHADRDTSTELEAARAEIDRLRRLCAEVYQVAGALGADPSVLDQLWAAAQGQAVPPVSLLPYTKTGR
jgi:hypothetical protein